jgi:hypothetical protein
VKGTFSARAESPVGVLPLQRGDARLDDDGVEPVVQPELRQIPRQLESILLKQLRPKFAKIKRVKI